MEFIPYNFERRTPDGKAYLAGFPDNIVLKQRRLELGMSQQQVADKAGILLRQYYRLEAGERGLSGVSARIFLSVCAVLKLDPYCFFPDIKQENENAVKRKSAKPVIIKPVIRKSKFVPFSELKELMCKIPSGKVVTRKAIEDYFCKKYDVEVVVVDEQNCIIEQINKTYPYWREVGQSGVLYATTRLHSRDIQERLLKNDGVEIIEWGKDNRSLKVKDFKERLFDLEKLL